MTHSSEPRASFYTLGCRLNQTDSALMADDLQRHGYRIVAWGEPAELLIINSCSVTGTAAGKARKVVRAARRRLTQAFIVVVGCDVDISTAAWQDGMGVDLIVGNAGKAQLNRLLPPGLQRSGSTTCWAAGRPGRSSGFHEEGAGFFLGKTRANLKIQEGCDFSCSYCIVPHARGPARSRDWDDILREATILAQKGYREIVLTGVNIATYLHAGNDLAHLTEALLEVGDRFRIRLSSTEPGPVLQRVVGIMQRESRVCRFLHLPLQYGDDAILQAMNRRYSVSEYALWARAAAAQIPGLCLGTDVIVGFPGETEGTFENCCQVIGDLPLNHLHVFTFSPREGTPAAEMAEHVSSDLATRRAAILSGIASTKAEAFARSQIGLDLSVITEQHNAQGHWEGWSDNYLRVEIVGEELLTSYNPVTVRVTKALGGRHLRGIPLPAAPRR